MQNSSTSQTADLAAVAYEFGPFLFAILYITGLTIFAQRTYSGARNPEESQTFRQYFLISFVFGLLLVLICVGYWIYDRVVQREYAYVVDIQNTPQGVTFFASDAYVTLTPVKDQPVGTVHVVFVRESRLLPNETLILEKAVSGGIGENPSGPWPWTPVPIKAVSPKIRIDYSQLK